MKKIWIVLMEQEWEFGTNSSAGADYYLEHVSAHSTEEAAIEAAKGVIRVDDLPQGANWYNMYSDDRRVRIVSLDVDGPGYDVLD